MPGSSPLRHALLLCLVLLTQALPAGQRLGTPLRLHEDGRVIERHMGIRLLGALVLSGRPELAELSDLAWDQDEQLLYAVSDRGLLLHLEPVFENQRLVDAVLHHVYPLRDGRGKSLSGSSADAEGLALENGDNGIRGDSRLNVSFERKHRIARYTTDGKLIGKLRLPADLRDPDFYRGHNKGLEALVLQPVFGFLSAPEKPREGYTIPIYSISRGERWHYTPAVSYGALVAMENYRNDSLLVLERAYESMLDPLVITLSLLPISATNRESTPRPLRIASFDSTRGWLTQNFEGLARHQGDRYFMVSDDNGEPFLQTQLLYFEVAPE
ncbi:MAG: esterase-like activity of phytase family protein [Gammaproteobacteria bacterium]|nr:esterase-like activity of phytase family protein [Gammaproteobacteria bacterium]